MKVKIEFDSNTDREAVILLAVRAEGMYHLLDDLLKQLAHWIEENPNDEQGKAFKKTRQWLCEEIPNRGYYISEVKQAVPVDRAR